MTWLLYAPNAVMQSHFNPIRKKRLNPEKPDSIFFLLHAYIKEPNSFGIYCPNAENVITNANK